jgi:hypothetical protein
MLPSFVMDKLDRAERKFSRMHACMQRLSDGPVTLCV